MKIKKLSSQALQDIKSMADSLPEIWKGYQVTEDVTGQFVLECNMRIPEEAKNALGYINKKDVFSVTFDRYQILDHEKAMIKLVKKCKSTEEAKKMVSWYVGKYSRVAKQYFQTK